MKQAMKPNKVWIVEMKYEDSNHWHATVGCSITKEGGKFILREWRNKNPDDKFRLKEYRATT